MLLSLIFTSSCSFFNFVTLAAVHWTISALVLMISEYCFAKNRWAPPGQGERCSRPQAGAASAPELERPLSQLSQEICTIVTEHRYWHRHHLDFERFFLMMVLTHPNFLLISRIEWEEADQPHCSHRGCAGCLTHWGAPRCPQEEGYWGPLRGWIDRRCKPVWGTSGNVTILSVFASLACMRKNQPAIKVGR